MKIICIIVSLSVTLAVSALGDDMKTLKGNIYSNIVVQQYDQEGYVVLHDEGSTRVPFEEISPELRGHYKALSMIPISRARMSGKKVAPAGPEDLQTLSGQIYRNVVVKKVEDDRFLIAHDTGMDTIYFAALPEVTQQKIRSGPVDPDPAPGPNDIVTTYGLVFRNTTILNEEPDGLTFSHDGGVTKLGFPALPEETRQKYGYDPVASWKYAREQAAKAIVVEEEVVPTAADVPATFSVYAVETQTLPDNKFWVRFSVKNLTDKALNLRAVPCQEKLVPVVSGKSIKLLPSASKELQQFVVPSVAPTYLKVSADKYFTNSLLTWE